MTGDFAVVFEENKQRQYLVVSPFGLHSGLRQSGDAFGVAFFRGAEAPRSIPKARAKVRTATARAKCGVLSAAAAKCAAFGDGFAEMWWGGQATARTTAGATAGPSTAFLTKASATSLRMTRFLVGREG